VDGQTYAAVLAICPNRPGLCCVAAGVACVWPGAVVDMGRCCCVGPVARGGGAGAVGREGALGARAGAERPPRERGMLASRFVEGGKGTTVLD
jgi:hypothetical protein